jgi:two-component system, cell cycle sensor histidine kinase and response regulator CckA
MSNECPMEQEFETLFASVPGLYMVLDPSLRIVAATDSYLRATLTRRADILGRYVFDVFPDNPGDSSADAVRNSTASFGRVLQCHVTDVMGLQRHDVRKPESEGGGWEVRYWNAANSPVLKPDGSLAYIMHRVENVTELVLLQERGAEQTKVTDALRAQAAEMKTEIAERRRAEEALRENESRLRSLSEDRQNSFVILSNFVPQLVWMCTPDGLNIYFNQRWVDYTGLTLEESYGRGWNTPFHPDDQQPALSAWNKAVQSGGQYSIECRLRAADGSYRRFLIRGEPMRDTSGGVLRWLGTCTDIEDLLQESEQQYRTLANAIPQLCWMANADGWLFWYNQRWYEYTGTSPEQMEGWGWQSVHDPETLPQVLDRWKASLATGEPFDMVFPLRGADGVFRPFLTRVMPLRDPDGKVTRWFGTNTDISEQLKNEKELREERSRLHQSEERLRLAQTLGAVGVWDWDTRAGGLHFTPELEQLYGLEPGSIKTYEDWRRLAHPDDIATVEAERGRAIANGEPFDLEFRVLHASGETRWLSAKGGAIYDAAAESIRVLGVNVDITARKQAEGELRRSEAALRESEQQFRVLTENLHSAVALVDEHGAFRIVNSSFRRMFDIAQSADILNINTRDWSLWQVFDEGGLPLDVDQHPARKAGLTRAAVKDQLVAMKSPSSSDLKWMLVSAEPILDAHGKLHQLICTYYDITDRKRAEDALRESEARFRLALKNAPVSVAAQDRDLRYIWAHNQQSAMPDQIIGRLEHEIFSTDEAVRITAIKHRVLEEGIELREKMWFDRPTGRMYLDIYWEPIRNQAGQVVGVASATVDLTPIKLAEEALRESESRERLRAAELEALMEMTPAAIFVSHDRECRYMTGNRRAYDLLRWGREKNLSKSAPEGPTSFRAMKDGIEIPPAELPLQKAAATGQPVLGYAFDAAFDDGVTLNLLCDATPLLDQDGHPRGGVGVLSDVTELKRAEQRLRESQKLESLGLLAGGVAHDFNNLLVGVVGNASLAQDMLPPDHPVSELVSGVLKAGEQAAHLTRQMLAYSGKGKFVVEPLNLSAVIPEMIGLVRPSISKKITLHLDLDEGLPSIAADRGQVQQVFMNLTLNAAEAIGSHEGLIAVRTGVEEVDDRFKRLHPETALAAGKYVFLEVRDTGCGMDEATRAKIFDPFFSTKFIGRGLGLAAVDGIMRGHKGSIAVTSVPGQGSCFTVLLPPVAPASATPIASGRSAAIQGSGTVLVVDDEPIVRGMTKKALERHGYTVLTADSGAASIDIAKRHPGEIALVVLDLSMPHMSGEETLPELRKIRPDVKVVVSSGYSESEAMRLFDGQRVSGFIQKPFTSTGIAEMVKQCLG